MLAYQKLSHTENEDRRNENDLRMATGDLIRLEMKLLEAK